MNKLLLLFITTILIASCSKDDNTEKKNSIIGTWENIGSESKQYYRFNNNGRLITSSDISFNTTKEQDYMIEGDNLTIVEHFRVGNSTEVEYGQVDDVYEINFVDEDNLKLIGISRDTDHPELKPVIGGKPEDLYLKKTPY